MTIAQAEPQSIKIGTTDVSKVYIGSTQIRPAGGGGGEFNYGDWTNSVWSDGPDSGVTQGTVTKTSTYITFYSGSHSMAYLSDYPIDGTKDFLLEFNAFIPNTGQSYNRLGLVNSQNTTHIIFQANWEHFGDVAFDVNGSRSYSGEGNPLTADYFIQKEGGVLTMGWGGVTKYTNSSLTFDTEYYFQEKVYDDTLRINTAKLTYL